MMKQIKPQSAQSTLRKLFSACWRSRGLISSCAALSLPLLDAQASKTRTYVETLASPRLEGRLAGSNGERLASDFLVAELQKIGAKPLPGQNDFRLPFEFTAGHARWRLDDRARSARASSKTPDVRALSFSDNGDVEAPVVFAGYGIVVPESQGFGYDSYATLDVKDKIVLVLRYFPEDADQKTRGILARYADLRYKAMAARQHGAKAMIVVTGPRSPNAGELAPMTFRHGARRFRHHRRQRDRQSSRSTSSLASRTRRSTTCRSRSIQRTRTSTGFALPGAPRRSTRRSSAKSAPDTTSSHTCPRRRR